MYKLNFINSIVNDHIYQYANKIDICSCAIFLFYLMKDVLRQTRK